MVWLNSVFTIHVTQSLGPLKIDWRPVTDRQFDQQGQNVHKEEA